MNVIGPNATDMLVGGWGGGGGGGHLDFHIETEVIFISDF